MKKKTYNQIYYHKNRKKELERARRYRELNQEKIKEKQKEWYRKYGKEYRIKNIEKIREIARRYYQKNKKPYFWNEAKKEIQRRYRVKNKEKIAEKRKIKFRERLNSDINFRLNWLLRGRIISAIKKQLGKKAYKTIELLGCSIEKARNHIEQQFTPEMSWKNHGKIWEIDHIIPVSSFNLRKKENQKKAFHYTNLQPLIKIQNRTKGSKILSG